MKHRLLLACLASCAWLGTAQTQTLSTSLNLSDVPLPSARSSLPQLGLTADDQLSLTQERILGRILWRDMRSEPAVINDALVSDYLQTLTEKLAAPLGLHNTISLRAFAVGDVSLNAFAMPSGLLGIHSGLILNVAREGELAAVMAHEIGHVSQRHFARGLANQKDNSWIGLAGFAAAILAAKRGNAQGDQVMQGVMVGSQAVQASKQLSFSRDMEREADAVGFALMKSAQYDGVDMVRMLRRLGAASSLNETGTVYARSHPGVTERMANIEGRLKIGSASAASIAPLKLDFLLLQARVRALLALSPEQADEARGVFQSQLDKPSTACAAHYGLTILAMQSQRFEQARAQLALAKRAAATTHPWLEVLAFELSTAQAASPSTVNLAGFLAALDASNPAPATALFAVLAAQKAHPALAASDVPAAQRVTEQWLAQHPQDDAAWGALAALHTQQGNAALAAHAQAEQTAAMGVWASSITLLGTAIKLGEASVPIATQNQWRTRLQAIREIAADEKLLLEKFK